MATVAPTASKNAVKSGRFLWDGRESNHTLGVPVSLYQSRIVLPCLRFRRTRIPTDPGLSLLFPTNPLENVRRNQPLLPVEIDAVDRRWGVSMVSTANLTSRAAPGSIPGRSSRVAAGVANGIMMCYVRLVRFAGTSIPAERLMNEALRLIRVRVVVA